MLNKKNFMKICTASGYSCSMLSEASGIKESTLRSYIDNRVDIPSDKLIKLADTLGCTTDYLLGRYEETDLPYEVETRNSIVKSVTERCCRGMKVTDLKRHSNINTTGGAGLPIAVWPYNLLEDIFLSGAGPEEKEKELENVMTIPISGDQQAGLDEALKMLTSDEQEIIRLRYVDCLTLEEAGQKFGITRNGAREKEVKAIRKLRHPSRKNLFVYGLEGCRLKQKEENLRSRKERLKLLEAQIRQEETDTERRAEELGPTDGHLPVSSDISDLELSVRSENALRRGGIRTIQDILAYTMKNGGLRNIRNLGEKSRDEIIMKVCLATGLPDALFTIME